VAAQIAFDIATMSAPADTAFRIDFDNQDAGVLHNVAIHEGSASGTAVFTGETFAGVDQRVYDVPALAAGEYAFICSVHPTMAGTLTVQ
jgi:plastocyanin